MFPPEEKHLVVLASSDVDMRTADNIPNLFSSFLSAIHFLEDSISSVHQWSEAATAFISNPEEQNCCSAPVTPIHRNTDGKVISRKIVKLSRFLRQQDSHRLRSQHRSLHRSTASARSALAIHFCQRTRLPSVERSPMICRPLHQWHRTWHSPRSRLRMEMHQNGLRCHLEDHAVEP